MDYIKTTLLAVLQDFLHTIQVNWPYLLLAIVLSAVLRTYVGTDRIRSALSGRPWITIPAAVLFATVTPFCSCGTEAVVLGMMAGAVPWAPIIAFMVASPLTSPEELVYSAGLFGLPFALFYFVGATLIGLAAGAVAYVVEKRGWLVGQARMQIDGRPVPSTCCQPAGASQSCCAATAPVAASALVATPVSAGALAAALPAGLPIELEDEQLPYEPDPIPQTIPDLPTRLRLRLLGQNLWSVARRLVVFFTAFVLLGYLLIEIIPNQIIQTYLGQSSLFAIPLAAVLGIPFYLSSDASLPLIAALIAGGMGKGTALAFMVTGAGTSIGAIAGSLVIAKRRVVGLVIGSLLVGAIIVGELGRLFL
jgi:uncharacterized membrane protein YraQ (UPF0718 family)